MEAGNLIRIAEEQIHMISQLTSGWTKMSPKLGSNSQVSWWLVIDYGSGELRYYLRKLLAQLFCLPAEEITDSEQ